MSKKVRSGGQKQRKDRMFKQMKVRKNQEENEEKVKDFKEAKKVREELGKEPVTRDELFNVQNAIVSKIDASLMGMAAVVELMVKKELCTYEDFKVGERGMRGILQQVRKAMAEAYKMLGMTAKKEDISAFVYEKLIALEIDKEIIINIFGVKPSESRIIKPNQSNQIITSK